MGIIRFLRRNFVTIAFPSIAGTLIFLDWNYTRKWKLEQKKLQ